MLEDKKTLNRREFLKLFGVAMGGSLSAALHLPSTKPETAAFRNLRSNTTKPNIIVLLFDALSARHLSLYNYRRKTSPNLERFAQRAIVYNNHHSAGNFTSPSTGSLFTGSYPWTHRALHLSSQVRQAIVPFNIFRFLSPDYYQFAFTQSTVADTLIYQLGETLDEHRPLDSYSLVGSAIYPYLKNDEALNVFYAYDGFQLKNKSQAGSLFLALLRDLGTQMNYQLQSQKYRSLYPLVDVAKHGGPETSLYLPSLSGEDVYYTLDQLFDGLKSLFDELVLPAAKAGKPFLAYIHIKPPHAPYMPTSKFS